MLMSTNKETICMKYQNLFPGKNKKKYKQFVMCWIDLESSKGYLESNSHRKFKNYPNCLIVDSKFRILM